MSEPKEVFKLETQERLLSTAASDRSPDNNDGKRYSGELNWDVHIVDKLLYTWTPIILIICAAVLWTLIRPPSGDEIKITCWCPSQFTGDWVEYANKACLHGYGKVYIPGDTPVPDDAPKNYTELVDVLPRSPVDRPDMYMQIYLISAVLAVIPLLAWRMFGRLDGTGLIDLTEGTSSNQRLSSAIWFICCKLGAVIVLVIIYYLMAKSRVEIISTKTVFDIRSKMPPESQAFICDFQITSLGNRIHDHSAQCVVYTDGLRTAWKLSSASTLATTAGLWVITVLVVSVINAITVVIVFVRCLSFQYRKEVISMYGGVEANSELTSDVATVFVIVLAARNGQASLVQTSVQQLLQKKNY